MRFVEARRIRHFESMGCMLQGAVTVTGGNPLLKNRGELVLGANVHFKSLHHPPEIHVYPGGRLSIGAAAFINQGTTIAAQQLVTIGADALIGEFVAIHDTAFHAVSPDVSTRVAPVHIGRNVWIGHRAIILPGVSIGDHAVIAAGSVVTQDIPARSIAAGIPARVIRTFDCVDTWKRQ